jgi:hypothetical protein
MRLLLTNQTLEDPAGDSLYARELAAALKARGHELALYTTCKGRLAQALEADGIPVVKDLARLPFVPDLVQATPMTLLVEVLQHFPQLPAIHLVHNATDPLDEPFFFRRILAYIAVDDRCRQRFLRHAGIPAEAVGVILNFADLDRFRPRPPLPRTPRRALIFSNYATPNTHLPAVRQACAQHGIALDVAGSGMGRFVAEPEHVLPDYDLVFAKARCAIEALCVGNAVVVCDHPGLGAYVDSSNLDALRRMNFGAGVLTRALDADAIAAEIQRYDAADAAQVSRRMRADAGLAAAVDRWLAVYDEVLRKASRLAPDTPAEREFLARKRRHWRHHAVGSRASRWLRPIAKLPFAGERLHAAIRGAWQSYKRVRARRDHG